MNTLNVGHFLIINFRQNYLARSETQTSITRFLILRSLPVKSNSPIMPSHKRPISTFLRITGHSPWSICLLPWPERRLNGRCGQNQQLCIFQVDDGGTMFCNSSMDMIPFFYSLFSLEEVTLKASIYLVFPNILPSTPEVREPMWGFCRLLSMFIPIIHSETGKVTRRWVKGHTGPAIRQTSANTLLVTWSPQAPALTEGSQCFLGSPRITINSKLESNRP